MGGAAVTRRLGLWLLTMLICLDQLAQCWLRGWVYVWIGGDRPSADMTISDFVGRNAEAGKRWAIDAERAIDAFFGCGHCRRAILSDRKD